MAGPTKDLDHRHHHPPSKCQGLFLRSHFGLEQHEQGKDRRTVHVRISAMQWSFVVLALVALAAKIADAEVDVAGCDGIGADRTTCTKRDDFVDDVDAAFLQVQTLEDVAKRAPEGRGRKQGQSAASLVEAGLAVGYPSEVVGALRTRPENLNELCQAGS